MEWNWAHFVVGCLGGVAPEVARWVQLVRQRAIAMKPPDALYLIASVVYMAIGGTFAALFSGHQIGALYMGCSWPVVLSGARSHIASAFGSSNRGDSKRGKEEETEDDGPESLDWLTFDRSLFGLVP